MMTSRERVEAVLKHQIPDRVPTNISRPTMTSDEEAYFNKKCVGTTFYDTSPYSCGMALCPPLQKKYSPES